MYLRVSRWTWTKLGTVVTAIRWASPTDNPPVLVNREIQINTDNEFRATLNLNTDQDSRRQGRQDRSRSRARRLD